jgi:hypothetical protein
MSILSFSSDETCSPRESLHTFLLRFSRVWCRKAEYRTVLSLRLSFHATRHPSIPQASCLELVFIRKHASPFLKIRFPARLLEELHNFSQSERTIFFPPHFTICRIAIGLIRGRQNSQNDMTCEYNFT